MMGSLRPKKSALLSPWQSRMQNSTSLKPSSPPAGPRLIPSLPCTSLLTFLLHPSLMTSFGFIDLSGGRSRIFSLRITCPRKSPSPPKSASYTSILSSIDCPLLGGESVNVSLVQTGLQVLSHTLVFPRNEPFQNTLQKGSLAPKVSALPRLTASSMFSTNPSS